jgi:hypothetical protein
MKSRASHGWLRGFTLHLSNIPPRYFELICREFEIMILQERLGAHNVPQSALGDFHASLSCLISFVGEVKRSCFRFLAWSVQSRRMHRNTVMICHRVPL